MVEKGKGKVVDREAGIENDVQVEYHLFFFLTVSFYPSLFVIHTQAHLLSLNG